MKSVNKNNWMVFVMVILAIMNVSTFATILYHQQQSKKAEENMAQVKQLSDTESLNYSGRYFRARLNLDNNQMNRFRSFNPVFREQVRSISSGLETMRYRMLDEMAAEKSDTVVLNMISDSIGMMHSELKKCTYKYYLEIKSICDTEQQKKLEQIFNEMYTSDLPQGRPGKGGYRWRHGKRNVN